MLTFAVVCCVCVRVCVPPLQMLQLDEQIGKLIDQIKDHAKKRDFLADFYKEPISAFPSLSFESLSSFTSFANTRPLSHHLQLR